MRYIKPYKLFEATYYEDDLNVDITSTISDIFEDLTDDSDFDVTCFTVGYTTLKQAGATFTDNDIHFSISRSHYSHDDNELTYKTFTIDQILPYLKRTIDFIESEGRFASEIHYQYRNRSNKLKQMNIETIDELFDYVDFEIENLSMTFVLNSKKKINESILEIKEDAEYIQDIFSGVIDDGVRVFFARAGLPNRYTIKIGEYSDQVKFKYSTISNEIEHLKSYLINDCNMRLSDVEVDVVKPIRDGMGNSYMSGENIFGYGKRLEGWEKLNILKEKDTEMYSMAISFVRRGVTNI